MSEDGTYRPLCPVEDYCLIDAMWGRCVHCGRQWQLWAGEEERAV